MCENILSDIGKKTTLRYTTYGSLLKYFSYILAEKRQRKMRSIDELKQNDGNGGI